MDRVVIRPRIQVPILVVLFVVWTLLGVTYFTAGDVIAKRDWFGLVLGCVLVISGLLGIWRALRMGVVIDRTGIRVRGLDSRDRVMPWSTIESIECAKIDVRAGLVLYGPIIHLGADRGVLAVRTVGSYSLAGAERRVEQLRGFLSTAPSIVDEGPTTQSKIDSGKPSSDHSPTVG